MDFNDIDLLLEEEEEYDYEYERKRKERMRRRELEKQRQLQRRRIMRLLAAAAICVAVVAFGGTTLVRTIMSKTKEVADKATEEVFANTADVPDEALRQPIVDANNVSKLEAEAVGWQTDANGTWYQNADGSYYAGGWQEIDGSTYYFDDNGYRVTGWMELEDKDYYFTEDGVYDETVKKPMIALTFDDGPGKFTDRLLDCLEENNSKATFFMLGQNAQQYPEIVKREYDLGMELGNHTYDHTLLTRLDPEQMVGEINQTQDILTNAAGSSATVMRPPGGAYDDTVLSVMELPVVLWSIDTLDWKTKNVQNTIDVTLNNVTDGSIVLLHDIHETTVEAACQLIPELVNRGYKLVTVSEMAREKGITLDAGTVYSYLGEGEQMIE
ncbi:MAG: polysaccharide deacetylase family protein [Lachnospiraceae bacterium]|jgi:peptidoglycan/xylan/chitin deacetylase (PgdA/CDA1 family)